mmetsp:Transcript_34859/g.74310  ORF Transcript_34859/g.74310 Transcript_34859/m.74310 type:complete len:340 (-) Transcript_34859:534-1553(-)
MDFPMGLLQPKSVPTFLHQHLISNIHDCALSQILLQPLLQRLDSSQTQYQFLELQHRVNMTTLLIQHLDLSQVPARYLEIDIQSSIHARFALCIVRIGIINQQRRRSRFPRYPKSVQHDVQLFRLVRRDGHVARDDQVPLLELLAQRVPDAHLAHLLVELGGVVLHPSLRTVGLGPSAPVGGATVAGAGLALSLLGADLPPRAGDLAHGLGPGAGVALPAVLVALPHHHAVEDVDADGVVAEGLFRQVEGADFLAGFDVHDRDVQALRERDDAGYVRFGGEIVKNSLLFFVLVLRIILLLVVIVFAHDFFLLINYFAASFHNIITGFFILSRFFINRSS